MERNFKPKEPNFDLWTIMHWRIQPEVIWKPWGFYRIVSIVSVKAMVLFSTSGVSSSRAVRIRPEHIRNKTNSHPPWRDVANYRTHVHRALGAMTNTNLNEFVSTHLSPHGKSTVKISEYGQFATYKCELSPRRLTTRPLWFLERHSDHLAELSEEQHPFRGDMVSRASLISEFLVVTANLGHPSEHRSSTVCISNVPFLKVEHNAVTFTPF
jgi:hypothetical protein